MTEEIKKPKLLLIEDDAFMVDLLAHEFVEAGFDTSVAKNGAEGVNKFEEIKPDLVVLDLLLPDQHGFDVLRQIRRKPDGPGTKVIVLSNVAEGGDVEEAKRLGAVDYLVKANFSIEEIVGRIKMAVAS